MGLIGKVCLDSGQTFSIFRHQDPLQVEIGSIKVRQKIKCHYLLD